MAVSQPIEKCIHGVGVSAAPLFMAGLAMDLARVADQLQRLVQKDYRAEVDAAGLGRVLTRAHAYLMEASTIASQHEAAGVASSSAGSVMADGIVEIPLAPFTHLCAAKGFHWLTVDLRGDLPVICDEPLRDALIAQYGHNNGAEAVAA